MRVHGHRRAAVGLVAASLSVAGAPSATAAQWRLESLPAATGSLLSISCASPSACTAVGDVTLRWNGRTWVTQHLEPPASTMTSVSCPARRFCMAVGGPNAQRWNGVNWTRVRVPAHTDDLISVSCASDRFCSAVAAMGRRAERWNGSRWSVVRSTGSGNPIAVSCVAARACVAVGFEPGSADWSTGTWAGVRWSFRSEPAITPGGNPGAISCSTARGCTAVGPSTGVAGNTDGTLAGVVERWNGAGWRRQAVVEVSPTEVTSTLFNAVSCSALRSCTAVGASEWSQDETLAEHWDGRTWSIQPTPNPPTLGVTDFPTGPFLTGVSCPTARFCMAVGTNQPAAAPRVPFAERYSP